MDHVEFRLRALEAHWQIKRLPGAFCQLYHVFKNPSIETYTFLSLEALIEDTERWRGMLPQFYPFGHDRAEDFFGFYIPAHASGDDFAVLFWDHEYDHYYPIASGFGAFLGWCLITGRYLTLDEPEDVIPPAVMVAQRKELAQLSGLPPMLLTGEAPRNERELHKKLVTLDAQAAFSLLQLGCIHYAKGFVEKARDYFTRASEAAPWFADPYYLLAETYRSEHHMEQAIERWWQVFQCPIALSTRTSYYDLGEVYADAEIYEVVTEQVLRNRHFLPNTMRSTPLYQILTQCDPFRSQTHLVLADELLALGDFAGAEREMLNSLTLAVEESEVDAAYNRLIAFYERENRGRDAWFCREDAQRR